MYLGHRTLGHHGLSVLKSKTLKIKTLKIVWDSLTGLFYGFSNYFKLRLICLPAGHFQMTCKQICDQVHTTGGGGKRMLVGKNKIKSIKHTTRTIIIQIEVDVIVDLLTNQTQLE